MIVANMGLSGSIIRLEKLLGVKIVDVCGEEPLTEFKGVQKAIQMKAEGHKVVAFGVMTKEQWRRHCGPGYLEALEKAGIPYVDAIGEGLTGLENAAKNL